MAEELNGIIISHKPVSEASLKRLLLIFDKIYLLEPEENNFLIPSNVAEYKYSNMKHQLGSYGVLYNGENYVDLEYELLNKFEYAIKKGVLRVIDLRVRKFYEKNWLPLRLSYDFDTGNASLMNTLYPILSRDENISDGDGILRGGFISPQNVKIYPDIPPFVSFHNEEDNNIFQLDHQLMSAVGKLNRSLAVSSEFDLIPIFINENLARTYSQKIEIAKNNNEEELRSAFMKKNRTSIDSVQFLLHKITEIILPDEVLKNITVKELIIARNAAYNECIKLRRKLIRSITFLNEQNFDDKFLKDVNVYIEKEILPCVNDYQIKFLNIFNKFTSQAITFSSALGGGIIGVQQNLSPEAIAYLGAISGTVGNISSQLSNYIIKRRHNKFQNTFSYFINLKE